MSSYTRKLLLIDSAGAILSAFILGVVLVKFQSFIGMPVAVLQGLSVTALVFAIYSLLSFLFSKAKWRHYLKAIAILNIAYCLLTIGLGYYYHELLTGLDWLYIFIEVVIIVALSVIEPKWSMRKE